MPRWTWILPLTLALIAAPSQADEPVSFRREVMAILSRAGCNQGVCHGNQQGKGGFKLSLRGEDPDKDLAALTRDQLGRRINLARPEQSLILLKATGQVAHEGGLRFATSSTEHRLLLRWLSDGAQADAPGGPSLTKLMVEPGEQVLVQPRDAIEVRAWAVFADGSRKDVSSLTVFESTNPKIDVSRQGVVTSAWAGETTIVARYLYTQGTSLLAFVPARPDFRWSQPPPANHVDELVFVRLKQLRMNPSDLCSDSEFLRRAYVDLLGMLPTPHEARTFLKDTKTDKRARLIDALLDRPEFAEYWAVRWSDVLRNEEKQLDRKGVQAFYDWIRQSMVANKPLNQFAKELIASRGSTYKAPAANYYRALRDPHIRGEATAQVFLGIRMQCAKCHNHPFDRWTQNDYHQLAAFFARVQYQIVENLRKDKLDTHEFVGEQIVFMDDKSEVKHPYTGQTLKPRFLGGPAPELEPKDDRLLRLADWVADAKNPFFARAQANRLWSWLMGRGIVDPNDDFRQTNPPVNGPLLDALAKDLAEHGFDQKHLIRTIMNSRTYQLSSLPNDTNAEDETNFARNQVRSLPAEAILDAIAQASDTPLKFEGYPDVKRAGQLPSLPQVRRSDSLPGSYRFLKIFGKPERLLSCDCERSDHPTMGQALQLLTGDIVHRAVSAPDNRLGKLLKAGKSNAEIIEELFLASLCRAPTAAEAQALTRRVQRATDRREALEDILWAMLNSKEFQLRR